MAFRLQQIEIKRWHDDVNLHVNQLAYLVSNFFHRHPTSNMRQDIWPAIWENDAAQHSWTIHYIILVFLSAAASSNCASLIKIHFWRGERGLPLVLFAGEDIVDVSDVRSWQYRQYNITYYFLSLKNVTFWVSKRGEGRFCLIVCKWIHCGCIWRPLVTSMYWERRRKAVAGRLGSERGSEWVVYKLLCCKSVSDSE